MSAPIPAPRPRLSWAAGASSLPDTREAAREAAAQVRASLGAGPVDLVLAFYSGPAVARGVELRDALREELSPVHLAGVGASGVIAAGSEIERGPGLSLLAGRLPGVGLSPFVLPTASWLDPPPGSEAFQQQAPGAAGAELVLLFGDPFSLDIDTVLESFDQFAPGARVVGGMASAAASPEVNSLFLNDWHERSGGVAVAFRGALRADVVVSQGCRAVGPALRVTHGSGSIVHTLDGSPALERVEQIVRNLPPGERERVARGLLVGRPVRPDASGLGDYLVRPVVGADRRHGLLAVSEDLDEGERIRLHVRDAHTAREDLEMLLLPQDLDTRAGAALVFTCNGRGARLFGEADADITRVQAAIGGGVPAAGFSCAGEIGPLGSRSYVHGHTACVVVLRPA